MFPPSRLFPHYEEMEKMQYRRDVMLDVSSSFLSSLGTGNKNEGEMKRGVHSETGNLRQGTVHWF